MTFRNSRPRDPYPGRHLEKSSGEVAARFSSGGCALISIQSGGRIARRLRQLVPIAALALAFCAMAMARSGPNQQSVPAHMDSAAEKPLPWPGGIIYYDVAKLTSDQQEIVQRAMKRWLETGANIRFIPRRDEIEYVYFTGNLTAGNNTSHVGF